MSNKSELKQTNERSIRLKNLEIERKRLEKENEEKKKKLIELQEKEILIKQAAKNCSLAEKVLDERHLEIHIEKEEEIFEEERSRSHSGKNKKSSKRSRSSSYEKNSKRLRTEKEQVSEKESFKKGYFNDNDISFKIHDTKENKKTRPLNYNESDKKAYKDFSDDYKKHRYTRSYSSSPQQNSRSKLEDHTKYKDDSYHHHFYHDSKKNSSYSSSKHKIDQPSVSPPIHHKSAHYEPSSMNHRSPSPTIETSSKLDYVLTDSKYFLIKSSNHENVALAQAKNIWSTPPPNEAKFNQAFKEHSNVILIFSIKESGHFQGYARLKRESDKDHPPIRWVLPVGVSANMLSTVFHLQWINKKELAFDKVHHLRNSLNEGRCVKIGRDGQEVDEVSGEALCRLFPKDESIKLREIAQTAKDSLKAHNRTVEETRERIRCLLMLQERRRMELEEEMRAYEEEKLMERQRRAEDRYVERRHFSPPRHEHSPIRIYRGRVRESARRLQYPDEYSRRYYSRSPEARYDTWKNPRDRHYRPDPYYEDGRMRSRGIRRAGHPVYRSKRISDYDHEPPSYHERRYRY